MSLFHNFLRIRILIGTEPLQQNPWWKTFFFIFCHNKAGGVRGNISGVSDPAWLSEQCYSTSFWLAALICQRGKQELPVPSRRACKQKDWVGGRARPLVRICTNTHTFVVKLKVWMCCTKCSHLKIFRRLCFHFDWLSQRDRERERKNNNNIK